MKSPLRSDKYKDIIPGSENPKPRILGSLGEFLGKEKCLVFHLCMPLTIVQHKMVIRV